MKAGEAGTIGAMSRHTPRGARPGPTDRSKPAPKGAATPKKAKAEGVEDAPRGDRGGRVEPVMPGAPIPLYTRIGGSSALALEHTEWVLTNALGGYAMGTALGMPTRRYHSLLITDSPESAQRRATLNHVVERLIVRSPADGGSEGDEVHELSTMRFVGDSPAGVTHPGGHTKLVRFEKDVSCRWTFHAGPVEVVKELILPKGTRAGMLRYQVKARRSGVADVRLELLPLVAMRDYHALRRAGDERAFQVEHTKAGVPTEGGAGVSIHVQASGSDPLMMTTSRGEVRADLAGAGWWRNFLYRIDRERGQDHVEDLFCPGVFAVDLAARKKPDAVVLRFGVDERELAALDSFETELFRLRRNAEKTIQEALGRAGQISDSDIEPLAALALAADDFVVHPRNSGGSASSRDTKPTSIIAGYPWFTDWGRDTMISLPGLLLESGRWIEALAALRRFAEARRRGIIPNRFMDGRDGVEGEAEYNTIDASLWFIITACRYLESSRDRAGFEQHLLPACLDVIQAYRNGTEFGIAMDPADFLITGGSATTQLTWMDARRDGVSFTPRHGKAVEVNALWHSGLRMLAEAIESTITAGTAVAPTKPIGAGQNGRETRTNVSPADLRALADSVAISFRGVFYSEALGCCHDVITPDGAGRWQASGEVRPNQVFAVSLPHSPLTQEQQRQVLRVVREQLQTPLGLRTLAPGSRGYSARFRGTMYELDAAYHNGTVWPWLIGAYAEAVARVGGFSGESLRDARRAVSALLRKLDGECAGSIAEVFDAEATNEEPARSGGCPAQAWSVAEVRRVWSLLSRSAASGG